MRIQVFAFVVQEKKLYPSERGLHPQRHPTLGEKALEKLTCFLYAFFLDLHFWKNTQEGIIRSTCYLSDSVRIVRHG